MTGALTGILITFLISEVTYPNNDIKIITPAVPTLCPGYNGAGVTGGCAEQGLGWHMFVMEALATFVLVFTYLVIRNFDVSGAAQKWMTFVGPLVIMNVYEAVALISSSTSRGPTNPTLAFELYFWSLGAYNYIPNPTLFPGQT